MVQSPGSDLAALTVVSVHGSFCFLWGCELWLWNVCVCVSVDDTHTHTPVVMIKVRTCLLPTVITAVLKGELETVSCCL